MADNIVELAPFSPLPWQIAPLLDKSDVLFLGGSAGGGKSRLAAEKLCAFANHYPGATVVASRKKRDDMDQSTIPLIRDTVLDVDHNPRATFRAREDRIVIDHGIGKPTSEVLFRGIFDERAREGLRSIGKEGAADMWWMEEAIEFEEDDFNAVIARLRGNAAGWNQIVVSTNPGPELHWINLRLILGNEAAIYLSNASMNPYNAAGYQEKRLDKLTGVDRARLRDGLWIDGTGLVISSWVDQYNPATKIGLGNVRQSADYIPGAGDVIWFADDGYAGEIDPKSGFFRPRSNPRVFLFAQIQADDTVHIFHEDYRVKVLADVHIAEVLQLSDQHGYARPKVVVYDGAAPALGGQLTRKGLNSVPIRVKIDEGLKEVREWVGEDYNGLRRVQVHPRCRYFRKEMGSYAVDKNGEPIDANNHGPDALRYGIWWMAYGQLSVSVAGTGTVDLQEIHRRVAELYATLQEKHADVFTKRH